MIQELMELKIQYMKIQHRYRTRKYPSLKRSSVWGLDQIKDLRMIIQESINSIISLRLIGLQDLSEIFNHKSKEAMGKSALIMSIINLI